MTKQKKSDPIGPQTMFDGDVLDIEGRRCLGTLKPVSEPKLRVLFVQHAPESSEAKLGRPYSSKQSQLLLETLNGVGFDTSAAWFTYAVKYFSKSPAASDEKWCRMMLDDELRTINPDIVVVFGAEALRNIAGPASRYQISACRGAFVKVVDKNGENPLPYLVYPCFDLSQVLFNEQYEAAFERDLKRLADRVNGTEPKVPEIENHSLKSVEDLNVLELALRTLAVHSGGHLLVALDCEWGGKNWMDPNRYFRTIQLGMDDVSTVYTIEIAKENGVLFEPRQKELFEVIRKILEAPYIDLVGHNIIADGEWLLSYGIDIRPRVVYDTMLAEYLIDSTGPFGLEELTMKYTDVGRYSWEVEVWCKQHKKTVEGPESYGYAQVPHEMLLGYAAWDVAALHLIMQKQMPILEERGYFERRGIHGEHPSMFDTTMAMQKVLYELEINGWPTDHTQLDMLTEKYGEARAKLLAEVMQMSRAIGFENFNPRSSDDIRKLLFSEEYLNLAPVKTTGGDSWADAVGNMGMDDEEAEDVRAATDKTTLEILDGSHPLVHKLLQFKRIDQSCKTWLRKTDDKGNVAGLYKQLWEDGNIHPHYSPLTQTGRLRTSNPNSQNLPKQAEAFMTDIFGKGNEPPVIRTIVKPKEGWVQLEGDFCQAELFTLANLSQDQNMLRALTTPGLDLHDKTATDAFGLTMIAENGDQVTEEDLIRLAREMGGADSDEYEHFMKALTYVDQHGKRMTRAEFKSSIRVAAKAINFGIAYGRGAKAIALQVKAQTGDPRPVDEIEPGIAVSLKSWKTVSYPQAWNWLLDQQKKVYNPGWIENPFGRRKWAHLHKYEKNAAREREFGNFPIQSTVSDAVQIAMDKMLRFMHNSPFPFRLQNQIHDAVMIETPIEHIQDAKDMFQSTLAGIDIPIPGTGSSFRLGIDIDVYERWGVKMH